MRDQQLIEGLFKQAFLKMCPQNRAAFYKRQEYVKDGTKTLVALERPRSD